MRAQRPAEADLVDVYVVSRHIIEGQLASIDRAAEAAVRRHDGNRGADVFGAHADLAVIVIDAAGDIGIDLDAPARPDLGGQLGAPECCRAQSET